MAAQQAAKASTFAGRAVGARLPTLRATAHWMLFFGISFALTAGFLLIAHA